MMTRQEMIDALTKCGVSVSSRTPTYALAILMRRDHKTCKLLPPPVLWKRNQPPHHSRRGQREIGNTCRAVVYNAALQDTLPCRNLAADGSEYCTKHCKSGK